MATENGSESRAKSLRSRLLPAALLLALTYLVLASWWVLFFDLALAGIAAKALLFLGLALAAGIFLALRRHRVARRGGALEPLRLPTLLADASILAGLLSFGLVFPLLDLIYLLRQGQLSWVMGTVLVGLPAAVLLVLSAVRRPLVGRNLGCLIFGLSLLLCPVLGLILLLVGSVLNLLLDLLEDPGMGGADWGNLALLVGAVVACALLLFLGAKRLARRNGGASTPEE